MFKLNMSSPFGGSPIFFKPETESTMTDVKNLASQGLPSGTVVTAGHQIAGRGRFPDRRWISAPGESLAFSIFFQIGDFPGINGAFPLRAGLAAVIALEKELNLKPEIKWPNDVYLRGRKAVGILAENRDGYLFIGIGVNCGPKSYPRELKKTAISLAEVLGRRFPPDELLLPVLNELKAWLFPADNGWKEEIEKRLYLKGKEVAFLPGMADGTGAVNGQILGISEDGSLLLKSGASAEPRAFASGEIRYTPPRKSFFARLGL
jgi:BirA family biotin operon repressor/biotin-[acetyl-CoA-carboxylase] ligase